MQNQEFQQAAKGGAASQQVDFGAVRPKKTNLQHMCKGSLPLDRAGIVALPKLPPRQLVVDYLDHHHVSEDFLKEHFSGMFQTFMSGAVSKKYDGLDKIVEKRFLK
jgi:hypothetical protein